MMHIICKPLQSHSPGLLQINLADITDQIALIQSKRVSGCMSEVIIAAGDSGTIDPANDQSYATIEDEEYFEFCTPAGTRKAYIFLFSSISCCLFIYIVLWIIQKITIRFACNINLKFEVCINIIIPKTEDLQFLLGTIGIPIHFYMMSKPYGSLVNCQTWYRYNFEIWYTAEFILLCMNIIFFVLMFFKFIGNKFKPLFFDIVWSTWPLVQDLVGIYLENYIYAFQFIILYRCTTKMYLNSLRKLLSYFINSKYVISITDLFVVIIYVFMAAGFIQSCEDFTTNVDKHPGDEDYHTIVNITDYIWFTYVTLTTVGYGDLSPRTRLGRVSVCFIIIVFGMMFMSKLKEIRNWIREIKNLPFYRASIPVLYPRAIIVGNVSFDAITNLLKQNIGQLSKYQVILVGNTPCKDLKWLTYTYINFHYIIKPYSYVEQGKLLRALFNGSKDEKDMLIVLTDPYAGNEYEDNQVFHWITYAKDYIHERVNFVLQVVREENKNIIQKSLNERKYTILCIEELTEQLILQNAKCPGFIKIIRNIISRESQNLKCEESKMFRNNRLSFHMIHANQKFKEDHIFKEAAKNCFLNFGILLLGSIDEQGIYAMFPATLQKKSIGIFYADKLPQEDPDTFMKIPPKSSSTYNIQMAEFIPMVAILCLSGEQTKYQTLLKNSNMITHFEYHNHRSWLQSNEYAGFNSLIIMDNFLEQDNVEILHYVNLFYTTLSKYSTDIAKPHLTYQVLGENAFIALPLNPIKQLNDDFIIGTNSFPPNSFFSMLDFATNNTKFTANMFNNTYEKISAIVVKEGCSYGELFLTLLENERLLIGIKQNFNANYGLGIVLTCPSPDFLIQENDLAIIVKL